MFKIKTWGNYKKIKKELRVMKDIDVTPILYKYGQIGVKKLADATPVRSGKTRDSWEFKVSPSKRGKRLIFYNTNVDEDCTVSVAVLLIHGHVSVEGTWIEGHDFVTDVINELCLEIKSEIQ